MKNGKGEGKMKAEGALGYLIFLLIAYGVTAVLLLLLALLLFYFQINSKVLTIGIIITYVLSTFTAGFLAGKKAKNKKYLWGLLMGGGYYLILALVSLSLGFYQGGSALGTGLLLCCMGGMLGGMVS